MAEYFKLYAAPEDTLKAWQRALNLLGLEKKTRAFKRVATQFDKTNDAALANITDLVVNVTAGRTYVFRAVLFVTADAIGGHKYAISGTAVVASVAYQINSISNATNAFVVNSRQTSLSGSAGQAGATVAYTEITGSIYVTGTGTLTVQFAQDVATPATTSSVLVGSMFIVEEA